MRLKAFAIIAVLLLGDWLTHFSVANGEYKRISRILVAMYSPGQNEYSFAYSCGLQPFWNMVANFKCLTSPVLPYDANTAKCLNDV